MKWLRSWLGSKDDRRDRQKVCRHCLKPFVRRLIGVECRSPACRDTRDHLGEVGPRFSFAEPAGFWRDGELDLSGPCADCGLLGHLRSVCPHCRGELSLDHGDDRVLAVIGASASGKTHFLAAVLHQLLEAGVGGDRWRVDLPPDELRRLRRDLLSPLFEDHRLLPTTADRVEAEMRLPMVHEDGRRVLLAFRDLGGEVFLQADRLRREEFLRYAQGIVLMADPLAFDAFAPHGDNGEVRHVDAVEILERYRTALETQERRVEHAALPLLPDAKFLAVAVTKADRVLPDDDAFWAVDTPEAHLESGYWSARDAASDRVEGWVEQRLDRRGRELIRETGSFAETSWFFVSSLGRALPPGRKELAGTPEPQRVHEPIFALLDRLTEDLVPVGAPGGDFRPEPPVPDVVGEPRRGDPAPRRRPETPRDPDGDWDL